MTTTLDINNGECIHTWSPENPQWWITDFIPRYQNVDESDLKAYGSLVFTSDDPDKVELFEDMYYSFKDTYEGESIWDFDDTTLTASFK